MNHSLSLQGLRILNTRPLEQSSALSHTIHQVNGRCIDFPLLAIEPMTTWLTHLVDLEQIHYAVFISANAVHCFFKPFVKQRLSWPKSIQTITIGKQTALALHQWQLPVNHVPNIADSEHLLQLEALQHIEQKGILIIKGEGGRPLIENTLQKRGAHIYPVNVYRRVALDYSEQDIASLWQDDLVDIILFTSQQAMEHLFRMLGEEGRAWLCEKRCLVISERLAAIASFMGIKKIITARYDNVLESLYYNVIKNKP